MSTPEIRVDRVLGAGPFCEIGRPRVAKTSPDGTLIVVGGALAHPQWHGHDVSRRSRPNPGWYPVAVYQSDDFTCLYQLTARWPANAISFHPALPLVAIGTGSYDGGWFYEGELLLLDLTTGTVVSLMAHRREVQWIFTADHQATALDADGDFVYLVFNSGELVVLDAENGAVHARQELRVNGHRIVPLSLTRVGADRLAVGTLDGRVLDCSIATGR